MWLHIHQISGSARLRKLAGIAALVFVVTWAVFFFMPRTIEFSFDSKNCIFNPMILPDAVAKKQGSTFTAEPAASVSVAGFPLYSHRTCIQPVQPPAENTSDVARLRPFGVSMLSKRITVTSYELPTVHYSQSLSTPISTTDPLIMPLSSSDYFFDYRLTANDKSQPCDKQGQSLSCDVRPLDLSQSASYTFTMQRVFNGQPHQTIFSEEAATVDAVVLASSSIASGGTVFEAPSVLTLTFNKTILSFDNVRLVRVNGEDRQEVETTSSAENQTITVQFSEPLERSASFEFNIGNIVATDGAILTSPLILPFTTSGGPKVTGVNIDSYRVSVSSNVTITFDSAVSASQTLSKFVSLQINGTAVAASVKRSGNTVTINTTSNLAACTSFKVVVSDGLENEFGVSGGSAWSFDSRTTCHSTFSIGSSAQGRSITGYRFGSGGSSIVFVGGTHGDEKSSVYTLNSLVDYLERRYGEIPANRTVIVIPNVNPDGFAASTRVNAHDVDLNRNFPANNWKQGVTLPGGTYYANGGGSSPLSEPESSALTSYITSLNPRLVLTYHAAAGVVIPNTSGDSDALAHIYDQKSNLYYEPFSSTPAIFEYDTTGAFEDWLHDKKSIPAILIELWTKSSNEFNKNQNAMWHMVTLP